MKQKIIALIFVYLVLLMWLIPIKADKPLINEITYDEPREIKIELVGEVIFPGVYTIYNEVLLRDLINYAYGFTNNADISSVDLNQVIKTSTKIHIPSIKSEKEDENIQYILTNINEATFMELLLVPNITEKRAANIIIYREQNGPFSSIEQLINVKGIGSATFEKISSYIKT